MHPPRLIRFFCIVLFFFVNELPIDNAALQDATGLHLGAPVATIKRNAQGVVTGFREAKVTKPGDGLMRRYEVQVRLNLDNSSVYLYPDQLNVLSSQQQVKQNQQQPVTAQLRAPPNPAKEPRTLDAGVVNAAVRPPPPPLSPSVDFLERFSHFCRFATLLRLSPAPALKAAAAR